MFLHDARVLDRHQPTGERNHFRAQPHMLVVQRRFFLVGLGHGPNVAQVAAIDLNRQRAVRVNRPTLKRKRVNLTLAHCMATLDKLERRLRFLAIPGFIRVVVGLTALVFVMVRLNPEFRFMLDLDATRIRQGEVWRLVTYVFLSQTTSFLWILLVLWFLWFIGEGLEQAWGAFRVTLYFIVGMIGTTAAAFFFGARFSNSMLYTSLFFAFARFYPDQVIYLFFILPVKIKWIAGVSAAFLLFGFVVGSNSYRMALVAALANYLIFFGPEIIHEARHRDQVSARRRRYEESSRGEAEPLHKCAVCGATELTDPNLDFRVARDGEEYCMEHLSKAETPKGEVGAVQPSRPGE